MPEFDFSKLSDCLEDDECFYNPATGYVTGEELKKIKKKGDKKAQMKWLYFFPVDKEAVGRRQKVRIFYREAALFFLNFRLKKEWQRFIIIAVASGVLTIFTFSIWRPLLLIPLGFLGFQAVKYLWERFKLKRQVNKMEKEISELKKEIDHLLKQVESFQDAGRIERMLKDEVKKLEFKAMSEIVHQNIESESQLSKYIQSQPTDKYFGVRSLLITGWGIMQPFRTTGVGGSIENTGLQRVLNDLDKKALAVCLDTQRNPIFRVYYFQFIFLLKNNLNVASFFYDFVHRKRYGNKLETYQYPQVAHYSIKESGMEESQIQSLGSFMNAITNKQDNSSLFLEQEFKSFSLHLTSGYHFKCVLVDNVVRDSLNRWFEAIDTIREYMKLDPKDQELRGKFTYPTADGTKKVDEKRLKEYIEEKKKELVKPIKSYQTIRNDYETVTQAEVILRQVRCGVERFAR